jgi:dihydrolipoyl dehydrogenase
VKQVPRWSARQTTVAATVILRITIRRALALYRLQDAFWPFGAKAADQRSVRWLNGRYRRILLVAGRPGEGLTVVEVLDRVLPVEDEEISDFVRKSFEKQGIKIHTGATVSELERSGGNVVARFEGGGEGGELTVERVILAVGIVGNVENIGLADTGVEVERSHVVVDEWLRTGEPGVYAIGDLVGPPWLAHKAMHERVICVERIAGVNDVHPLDLHNIPSCTYCRP